VSDISAIMKAAASSQKRIVPDTDLAIRQLASVIKNRIASEEEVVRALRHWSRAVVEHRQQSYNVEHAGGTLRRALEIEDIIDLSPTARARFAASSPQGVR
jgi:hypothetical protein